MTMPASQIWTIIAILAVGTFLIRFSFIGLIGNRKLPAWVLRHLRYTPVAVLPGLVAPLVLWPDATGGALDIPRLLAAAVTISLGDGIKEHLGRSLWRCGNTFSSSNVTGLKYAVSRASRDYHRYHHRRRYARSRRNIWQTAPSLFLGKKNFSSPRTPAVRLEFP